MDEKKDALTMELVENLDVLRAKSKLTQEELAGIVGISRQTYSQIENHNIKMSWTVYLAILLLFDSIPETSVLLAKLGVEPHKIMLSFVRDFKG